MKLEGLTLDERLVKAITEMGYTDFTPIQLGCIPHIQKGKDVLGQSSTGSGKTAAFGLPILEKITAGAGVQALILTPTRELCVQVADSLSTFAKYTKAKVAAVYGGVGIGPQVYEIRKADIVVGTPGRILDHMRSKTIFFDKVKFFVLDETDRMCDMGFYDDVESIIKAVPKQRQTLLFSATYTKDVDKIISSHMNSPVSVKGEAQVDPSHLDQSYYDVAPAEKFSVLVHLLKKNTVGLSMVFCRTRREVDVVAKNLKKNGIDAMAIHGGLTQGRRLKALDMLKQEHIDTLVATDVAARGLDIKGVTFVYNYDVPPTPEEYIHRIGRTARAGKNGHAISLLAPADHYNFRSIILDSSIKIRNEPTPTVEMVPMQRRFEPEQGGWGARRGMQYGARSGPRGHSSTHGGYRHKPTSHSGQGYNNSAPRSYGAPQGHGVRREHHSRGQYTEKSPGESSGPASGEFSRDISAPRGNFRDRRRDTRSRGAHSRGGHGGWSRSS